MMKHNRRIVPAVLLFALLFSGCGKLAEGSYSVVTDHTDSQMISTADGTRYEVHTYSGLLTAVQTMVAAGMESGVIRAVDYSGSAQDDISRVCQDVTREYPLACYAVDYISHTTSRILGYYEITVHISYKLTQEEMSEIRAEPILANMYQLMEAYMVSGKPHLAVQIATLAVTERTLISYVDSFYRQHPELLYEQPSLSVAFYPEEDSVSKIITFDFSYRTAENERHQRLNVMNTYAAELLEGMGELSAVDKAQYCCRLIADRVKSSKRDSNAYDTLILGQADSEGCAMAFQLLCNLCGVTCQVVSGKLTGSAHYWNIIRIGRDYYHVDAMTCAEQGDLSRFLMSDAEMIGTYWWDVDKYPACDGKLSMKSESEETEPKTLSLTSTE